MRTFRRAIELGLPILGMAVVFGGVLFVPPTSLQIQVLVILVGVLILEAGVWGLTSQILPNERHYIALRDEGDHFINLIRNLNAAALARKAGLEGSDEHFEEALAAMHASVERMAGLAGEER